MGGIQPGNGAFADADQHYRALFDHIPVGLYRTTHDGQILHANQALVRMFGYPDLGSLKVKNVADLYADPAERQNRLAELEANGSLLAATFRGRRFDGTTIWVRDNARALRLPDGQVHCYEGAIEDVTESHQAALELKNARDELERRVELRTRELAASEERLRATLNSMSDLVFVLDQDGVFVEVHHPTDHAHLPAPPEKVLGRSFSDVLPTDTARLLETAIRSGLRAGQTQQIDYPIEGPEGELWYSAKVSIRRSPRGTFDGVTVVVRNMTERKLVEQRLRFLSLIAEQVSDAIIATDLDFKIVYVNRSFQHLYGYTQQDIGGHTPELLNAEADAVQIQSQIHRVVAAGQTWRGEHQNRRKDGSTFPCEMMIFPLVNEADEVFAYAGLQRNIAERKRAADQSQQRLEELSHVSRLATMGEMASCWAHELNQPLSAIVCYARGCVRRFGAGEADPDAVRVAMEKVAAQAERAGALLERLREFVRRGPMQFVPADANLLVREALRFAEFETGRARVPIKLELTEPLRAVRADTIQVEQVLLNLIRNGIEAMSATAAAGPGPDHPHRKRRQRRAAVLDNRSWYGVQRHDGRCDLRSVLHNQAVRAGYRAFDQSDDYRGARRAALGDGRAEPRRYVLFYVTNHEGRGGAMAVDATVFVVDDDEELCAALQYLLESADLKAETYGSAQAFLNSYDPHRPGCLVLDVRMHGMSGLELHSQLKQMDSELPRHHAHRPRRRVDGGGIHEGGRLRLSAQARERRSPARPHQPGDCAGRRAPRVAAATRCDHGAAGAAHEARTPSDGPGRLRAGQQANRPPVGRQ